MAMSGMLKKIKSEILEGIDQGKRILDDRATPTTEKPSLGVDNLSQADKDIAIDQMVKRGDMAKYLDKKMEKKSVEIIAGRMQELNKAIKSKDASVKRKAERMLEKWTGEKIELIPENHSKINKKLWDSHRLNREKQMFTESSLRYNQFLNDHNATENLIGKKVLDGLDDLDYKQLRQINQKLFGNLAVEHNRFTKEVTKDLKFNDLLDFIRPLNKKIAVAYQYAKANGYVDLAEGFKSFYGKIKSDQAYSSRVLNNGKKIVNRWNRLDDNSQRALEEYIVTMNTGKLKGKSLGEKTGAVDILTQIDEDALSAVNQKYKTNLGQKEVELAYQTQNFLAAIRKEDHERRFLKTDKQFIPFDIDDDIVKYSDYRKDLDVKIQGSEYGDLGYNFIPRKANEKGKAVLEANRKKNMYGYEPEGMQESFRQSFEKIRKEHSLLSDPEYRKLPSEALNDYFSEVMYTNVKKTGDMELKRLRELGENIGVFVDVIKGPKGSDGERALMKDMQSGKFMNKFSLVMDSIENTWNNAWQPIKEPKSELIKLALKATDVSTAAALMSPRLLVTNLFAQPLSNTLIWRDMASFMKGAGKTGQFAKNVFKERNFRRAYEKLKTDLDEVGAYTVNEFMKGNLGDVTVPDLMEAGKLTDLFNLITVPFKFTDLCTRTQSLMTALEFGRPIYNKIMKDSKTNKFGRLVKELHLNEFDGIQIDMLMDVVHSEKKFMAKFAEFAVNKEIYDYGFLNRPEFINKMRVHPFLARATRFMTWNFYYADLLGGMMRAAKAGDKGPLKRTATTAALWLAGASTLAGLDIPVLSDFASYSVGKTPLIGPMTGIATTPFKEIGGINNPVWSALMWLPIKMVDLATDAFGSERDSFDWLSKELGENVWYSPVMKPVREIDKLF